jgi:hypothetical protein
MDQPVQIVLDLSAFSVVNLVINLVQVWMLMHIIKRQQP